MDKARRGFEIVGLTRDRALQAIDARFGLAGPGAEKVAAKGALGAARAALLNLIIWQFVGAFVTLPWQVADPDYSGRLIGWLAILEIAVVASAALVAAVWLLRPRGGLRRKLLITASLLQSLGALACGFMLPSAALAARDTGAWLGIAFVAAGACVLLAVLVGLRLATRQLAAGSEGAMAS